MKEVKSSEKTDLLATVIGLVLTFAVGTGLSVLLNGFVQGFLVLGVVSIGLIVFLVHRGFVSIKL
jgi:hypothetical protein